jgi:hypothetical protein
MKKLVILCTSLLALGFTACSGSSSNNGGGAAPVDEKVAIFEKETAGTWLSECQHDDNGFYKDTLVINGGKGTTQLDFYQNQNCQGQPANTQGPTEFTYSASDKVNDRTKITMTILEQKVELTIMTNGDQMTVSSKKGNVMYTRIAQAPVNTPANGQPQQGGAEAMAVGIWVSEKCGNENDVSYREFLEFKLNGQGTAQSKQYQRANCGGEPEAQTPLQFTYKLEANGAGKITINNQNLDFSVQNKRMTVKIGNEEYAYTKVK